VVQPDCSCSAQRHQSRHVRTHAAMRWALATQQVKSTFAVATRPAHVNPKASSVAAKSADIAAAGAVAVTHLASPHCFIGKSALVQHQWRCAGQQTDDKACQRKGHHHRPAVLIASCRLRAYPNATGQRGCETRCNDRLGELLWMTAAAHGNL
jgi:hypothetical protein